MSGIPGGYMAGSLPGNMPFQIVNPQNPQMSPMSMFPMMHGMVPGIAMQNPANK